MMPLTSLLATLLLTAHEIILVKRKTVATAFCGLPHLLATGEPVAHACRVLPVDALEAEAEGHSLFAARMLGRVAASGPLPHHKGIWRTRRR